MAICVGVTTSTSVHLYRCMPKELQCGVGIPSRGSAELGLRNTVATRSVNALIEPALIRVITL
jgi:hypothetical protein